MSTVPTITTRAGLNDIGWLAGLLEGEGHFCNPRQGYMRIELEMTDRDVVERAAGILGGGRGTVRERTRPLRPDDKPTYRYCWNGWRAAAVAQLILPYMGARRSDKIKRLLKEVPA